MNCKKCEKELSDDNSSFCPDCITTLNTSSSSSNFIPNASLLTIIAAAFSLTAGVIGLISYKTYVDYFTYYSQAAPNAYAFWLIAGFALGAAALGFLSATYAFKKKRFALTIIGPVLMIVSGIFLFIVETVYSLGYSDGFSGSAIPAMVLSVIALAMLFKSKAAFVECVACPDDSDTESPEASEPSNAEQSIKESAA
ncbi:MAG TPA: hypothetical protein VLH35_04965 [Candidatus Acidoferrales bacterium]|nr:hypothetical protein [Candidatus Acidoferrales bacterium]